MNWTRTQKLWMTRIIGVLVSILISSSLYSELKSRLTPEIITMGSQRLLEALSHGIGILIILLVFLNWGMEAVKWKLLVKPLEEISWLRSFKSVLSGISISIVTPNRMGEYAGRIWYLKQGNRIQGITANIVGSIAQFIVAGSFGIIGMIYYNFHYKDLWFLPFVIPISIVLIILLSIGYFELGSIVNKISQFKPLKTISRYMRIASIYPRSLKLKLIYLSAIRYLIFAIQYWLMLTLFQADLKFLPSIASIFSVYWTMAIIPSLALTEIPLRAQTGIWYLGHLIENKENIAVASLLLWLINLMIPAMAGLLVLLGEKVFAKDRDEAISEEL